MRGAEVTTATAAGACTSERLRLFKRREISQMQTPKKLLVYKRGETSVSSLTVAATLDSCFIGSIGTGSRREYMPCMPVNNRGE